jgi:hypothetical protein
VVRRAVVFATCAACSLVFPASDYEDGGPGAGAGAGGAGGGGTGGTAGMAGMPNCGDNSPISNIVETFDGNAAFDIVPFQSCVDVAEDALVATPSGATEFCWARTVPSSRLACSSFSLRVDETLAPVLGAQTFLYLRDRDGDQSVELLLEGGGFQLTDTPFGDSSYDPDRDRYWRLRGGVPDERGVTTLAFDTSPDGVEWTERAAGPSPFSLDNVEIQVGAGIYLEVGEVGRAKFDCVNQTCP